MVIFIRNDPWSGTCLPGGISDQINSAPRGRVGREMTWKQSGTLTITRSFLRQKYRNILDMPVHEQIRSLNEPGERGNKSAPRHVES